VAKDITRGHTRYALRAYVDSYRYDATYPYDSLVDDESSVLFADGGDGLQVGGEARVMRPLPHGQTFSGGIEVRENADQNQRAAYDDNRVPPFETDVRTGVFGAYAQDEFRVKERLLLTVGGRYDAYSGFDRFSPKASVIFLATPARAFKYLVGSAFRAPNAYEFDYFTNGVRNDALRAETILTNGVVWEEYRGGWLRTSVAAYHNLADGLITLTSDDEGVVRSTNGGRVQARGVEIEAEMKASGVQALASYSWQKAEDRDTGIALDNAPRHLGKIRLGVPGPVAGSSAAFELRSMSERIGLSGDAVPGFAVANVNYIHPLRRGLTFTATALNLFDKTYGDPGFEEHRQLVIPQDGRTLYAGLTWKWTRK
jgi:outer membrane receptor protein involved in Fe transport